MDNATLKVVGEIAGIGGIALGVLLILFREVIRKNIFPGLSQEHGYRLLRLIVVLTWSVALAGLLAWLFVNVNTSGTKELAISGLVTDTDNNALSHADIVVLRANSPGDGPARTDDHGMFLVKINSSRDSEVVLRVEKDGFRPIQQPVKVPSSGLLLALPPAGAAPATVPGPPSNPAVKNPAVEPPSQMVQLERKHIVLQTPNAMKGPDDRRDSSEERCPEVTVMDFSHYPPDSKIERRCLP